MTPADIIGKLSEEEKAHILESTIAIVQDQIALEQHYERQKQTDRIAFTKFDAYVHLTRILLHYAPDLMAAP